MEEWQRIKMLTLGAIEEIDRQLDMQANEIKRKNRKDKEKYKDIFISDYSKEEIKTKYYEVNRGSICY